MHFNRVLSFLLLVAFVFAAVITAAAILSDEATAADPYDPRLEVESGSSVDQDGDPGEKIKYYLKLTNAGTEDDTYDITNSSAPAGWKVTISPTSQSLNDGDYATVTVSITSPDNADSDDSVDITITATSTDDPGTPKAKATLLLTYNVDQIFDVALSSDPGEETSKKVDPGDSTFFLLNLSNGNNGNGEDTIKMSKEFSGSGDGWIVIFSSNQVTLDIAEYSIINISVTAPNDASAGQFQIDIIATSEDNIETDSTTIIVDVNYDPDFIVVPYGGNQKNVKPTESVTYGVTVQNKGNDEDTFKFAIRPGTWLDDGWTASLDYNSITVSMDDEIDLASFLTVNAPDGLADVEATIIVNVTSGDDALQKTLNTRTKISQDFDPAISIVGGTTKSVNPGDDIDFTITVTNNGNGEDEIALSIINDDQVPGSWGSFSDSSVTLEAHTSTNITLTVTPPSDAAYKEEGYTLQIFGTSEDGENITTTKTLKVNVNKDFDLSVTISGASTKKVDPDGTVDFTVTVRNKGNAEDTILLTLYGVDSTWKPEWGSIVSSVDLTRDTSTDVTLSVTVPDDAAKADYKIGIKGTSDEDPSADPVNKTTEVIVSVNQTYAIIITIPAAQKSADVDSTVDYDLEIKNDGTGDDTLTLEVTVYPAGWQVNFNASTLVLGPKETGKVTMIVKTPTDENSIAFFVNFTATSQNAPEGSPVVKIGSTITTINQTYEFGIVPDPDYSSVQPGDTVEFDISFENQGTGSDHLKIKSGGNFPTTWTVSIASDISLLRDQTVVKKLTVSIDDETLKGEYRITLTGTSDDDPHTPAFSRQVNITINVVQDFNLTASISVDTQSIDPFPQTKVHKVTFEFTVNNTGTGLDKFEFSSVFDTTPARKNGWSVAFSPETIDLGVKKEGKVKAIVTVPYKETINTYGLTIIAISQGDSTASQSIKVFIDVNQTYSLDLVSDFNSQQITPSKIQSELKDINFTITVTNTGTGDDKFFFTLLGLPEGWFMNLAGNTGVMTEAEGKDFILNLRIPGREKPATYSVQLIATSDGRPEVFDNMTLQVVVDELHTLEITTNEPIKKGDVNNFTNFEILVTNKGTGIDTFTFDYRDVPNELTVSFPEGTGTEEIGPNNMTTKSIRVFIEDKTIKAKFFFNITVTSDEDESVFKMYMLTVDVNQSYALKASLISSPPGNKVEPDSTVIYEFEVTNDGTGTDGITIEVPTKIDDETNIPAGWKVTPIPYSFDLDAEESRPIDIEVEVDKDAQPETVFIVIYFTYHDGDEQVTRDITVIVNQTYDVGTNLNYNLLQIFPGFNKTATMIVKNTGTGEDYYNIEVSNTDGITATVEPGTTPTLLPDESFEVSIDFLIAGDQEPATVTFWINVTSMQAEEDGIELIDVSTIVIKIKETYGVYISQSEATYDLEPDEDSNGDKIFTLSVTNEGSSEDTFNFNFRPDNETQKYKRWITLPPSLVDLAPGASEIVTITISIPPYTTDTDAISDGILKNVIFYVYSNGAKDNNVVIEGDTTKEYLCHMNVKEYFHAQFTSVSPSTITMDVDENATVIVTLENKGNSEATFSFEPDGKDGGGLYTSWYEFINGSNVVIAPNGEASVTILVQPDSDAPVGTHDMEFHAEAGGTYETEPDEFTIDIKEKYGGLFVSTTNKSSDPGKNVQFSISVRNTGNDAHEFFMDEPPLPEGWANPSWDDDAKSINADSSATFKLTIPIPDDFTKALAKLYQFEVTGRYEDKGGSETKIPGSIILNLTVNTVYGVEVTSDEFSGQSGEPGETVEYQVKVKNSGNTNETYQLSILPSGNPSLENGGPWTRLTGVTPTKQVTIPVGETRFLPVIIEIPEFVEGDEDAEMGLYGVKIKAESTNESDENSELVFEFEVDAMFKVRVWSDVPGKDETLKENDATEMTFTMNIRNQGNTEDAIVVEVPNDEFSGEKKDWTAKFGTQTSKTVDLDSMSQSALTVTLTIDKNTDPGNYTLRVRAESTGDISVYVYATLYINLSKAEYGVFLEKFPTTKRKVNPADESEIEFKFTLTNTGNQDDTYTIEVETPLGSGVYKDWTMEFEDKDGDRVDIFIVPTDLKGNTDLYLSKNSRVDITLYVEVAVDEDEGDYEEIAISATSDNDNSQAQYLYFNLTVILPNIRVDDDPQYFYIEPDRNIEEDDNVDISVRIFNDGGAETGEFFVVFYNGKSESGNNKAGTYITYEEVENIPAGQYTDVLATWDEIPGGENDIYVYADKPIDSGEIKTFGDDNKFNSDGLVIESKENDNTASISDTFQEAIDLRPDLTITDIDFDDKEKGTTTTVTVTVANVGSASALSSTVRVNLKIGGTALKGKTSKQVQPFIQEEIDSNDDVDIEFTWEIPDEEKNYTVKVTVDHDEDSDSSNDRWTSYVETEAGDDGITGGDNILLLGVGALALLLIIVVMMVKMKSMSGGGAPPPRGPPRKGKGGPKGKPGARPPGGPPPRPGAKPGGPPGMGRPPKPGQKPITPPKKGKPGGPPGKPGSKPGGPPGKSMKPCPKCKTPIQITSAQRPLKLTCPKCGASGTLNK